MRADQSTCFRPPAAQGPLLERQNGGQRDCEAHDRRGKDPAEGFAPHPPRPAPRPPRGRGSTGAAREHDRAEGGDDEGRTQRTKKIHGAGCDAELMQRHRILHHHDGERERGAQPEPRNCHQAERGPGRKAGRRHCQRNKRRNRERNPGEGHALVMGKADD